MKFAQYHRCDKSYTGTHEKLEEYTKSNLCICIPDDKYFSTNYNYKNAQYKGCQFVAMSYQNVDIHMESYFNDFIKQAFLFKPSSLTNVPRVPKVEGINSLVPKDRQSLKYDRL